MFACVFYLFIMHLQSGGFHLHICLSWVCYYLWENPSHCLIQPSNHLLRVISCAFLNCKQNDLAYSAHCFSLGLTRHHSSNPVFCVNAQVARDRNDMKNTCELYATLCGSPFSLPEDANMTDPSRHRQSTDRLLYLLKLL